LSAEETCDDCSGESEEATWESAEEAEAWRSLVDPEAAERALSACATTVELCAEASERADDALAETDDELEEDDLEELPQPAARRARAVTEITAARGVRMRGPFVR
jgi:hypothetical protein